MCSVRFHWQKEYTLYVYMQASKRSENVRKSIEGIILLNSGERSWQKGYR